MKSLLQGGCPVRFPFRRHLRQFLLKKPPADSRILGLKRRHQIILSLNRRNSLFSRNFLSLPQGLDVFIGKHVFFFHDDLPFCNLNNNCVSYHTSHPRHIVSHKISCRTSGFHQHHRLMMSLSYGPVVTISVASMTNFIFLHENAELSTKTGGNPAPLPPKLVEIMSLFHQNWWRQVSKLVRNRMRTNALHFAKNH